MEIIRETALERTAQLLSLAWVAPSLSLFPFQSLFPALLFSLSFTFPPCCPPLSPACPSRAAQANGSTVCPAVSSLRCLCQPHCLAMGNEASYHSEMGTHFDQDEIKRLGRSFKKMDLDKSGSLSVDEFMSLPELQQNPLVGRVIDIFDTDGNGEVDFREFIVGTSQFSVKGDEEQKLRFAFRIYDMDNDGFISNGELFQVLKMMVGNNLKDWQLQQLVDKSILVLDKDGDGRISFEEFRDVVRTMEIHKKLVVFV